MSLNFVIARFGCGTSLEQPGLFLQSSVNAYPELPELRAKRMIDKLNLMSKELVTAVIQPGRRNHCPRGNCPW